MRRNSPAAPRRVKRPHARRLPRGRKATTPGEIAQVDTLTVNLGAGRPTIKHFTAADPIRWSRCSYTTSGDTYY